MTSRFDENCREILFPAVFNYDYETNIPRRGINDRSFRWQEVYIGSDLLFVEMTSQGDISLSSGQPRAVSIEDPNALASAGQENTTGFAGWSVSGDSMYFVSTPGLNLVGRSGYSGTLTPLSTSGAAASWPTGSNTLLYNTEFISGTSLTTGTDYQAFARFNSPFDTNQISVYVEGWSGSSVAAYYDPFSGVWAAAKPTGLYQIPSGACTGIKYEFNTDTFPAAEPTGYRLVVEHPQGEAPLVIDNLHIDKFLYRDPFVPFFIPTGYYIEFTPDLGWHDVSSMFESGQTGVSNPHLSRLGLFTPEAGNLTDNLDGSVTVVLDEQQLRDVTFERYRKYLWRAISVGPDGQLGEAGLPRRFEYVGTLFDEEFTVDPFVNDPNSFVKIITGTKASTMVVRLDDEESSNIEYPTPTTWKLTIHLEVPEKTIKLTALDDGGSVSSARFLKLTSEVYAQNEQALWNVFDEHGLLFDIERLPSESNSEYRDRLKDYSRNLPGNTFFGVVNGANRELGLEKIQSSIVFNTPGRRYNVPDDVTVDVAVTPYSIRIRNNSMYRTERKILDPFYDTITLDKLMYEDPKIIEGLDGNSLVRYFEQDPLTEDRPSIYRFKLNAPKYRNQKIKISYTYYEELLFRDYPTIGEMVKALNLLVDANGDRLIVADMSLRQSGNESCFGLYKTNFTVLQRSAGTVAWSPVFMNVASNKKYREHFADADGNFTTSKYNEYVEQLRKNVQIFWGSAEADRAFWDSAETSDVALDHVPTLFDPNLAVFRTIFTGEYTSVNAVKAYARGFLGAANELMANQGLTRTLFQPGIAHDDDLQVDFFITDSSVESEEQFGNVGPTRNNNKVVFFSGQR